MPFPPTRGPFISTLKSEGHHQKSPRRVIIESSPPIVFLLIGYTRKQDSDFFFFELRTQIFLAMYSVLLGRAMQTALSSKIPNL